MFARLEPSAHASRESTPGPVRVPWRCREASDKRSGPVVAVLGVVLPITLWVFLFPLVFYLVTWHAVAGRYPLSHSFAPNLIWSFEWAEQIRQGILYPRWMEHTFAGLGTPTFHFYGPLSMIATLPFSVGLGMSPSMGVLFAFWTAILVMALGMAFLTRAFLPHAPRWLPPLIATLSLSSPYVLCDVYERGALAETWAMAILPWLLSSLLRSLESAQPRARLALVATSALFALCHPPLLLLGTCSIGVAMVLTVRKFSDGIRWIRRGIVPIAVGLLLDSFYLLSATLDQRYVHINLLNAGDADLAFNRLLVTEMGRMSPKFATGFDGSLVPGFVACCLILALTLWLFWRRGQAGDEQEKTRITFLAGMAGVAVLMETDLARGLYALFPTLNRIQFAWRWLGVLTVVSLALWGYVLSTTLSPARPDRNPWRIPVWILTLWFATQAFATTLSSVDWNKPLAERMDTLLAAMRASGKESDSAAIPLKDCRDLLCVNTKDELIFRDVPEYRPLAQTETGLPPRTFAPVEWARGKGKIQIVEWKPGRRAFQVQSPSGGELLLRTTAWLGWEISVHGATFVGDQAGDWGRMLVTVPPGGSEVIVTYRGTPHQRQGNILSLITLGCLIAFCSWIRWQHPRGAVPRGQPT